MVNNEKSQMNLDTQQLLQFSKHYLSLAKRLSRNCPKSNLSKKIGQLYGEYPRNSKSNVYLLMAHLASAAFRAATIIEKNKLRDYDYRHLKKLKSSNDIESRMRSNLEKYLPMMLRDLVGHNLYDPDHELATPRRNVVHALTPEKCMNILARSIRRLERDLKNGQLLP